MFQRGEQVGNEVAQLLLVGGGELFEDFFALGGEGEGDLPTVFVAAMALDEVFLNEAIDEADGAVMADLQAPGQGADGEWFLAAKAADGEQRLVLLRGDAGLLGGVLAETDELPQCVAEIRQHSVFRLGHHGFLRCHFGEVGKMIPGKSIEIIHL